MGKFMVWWCLGAVFALLTSGCGGNDSSDSVAAPTSFPYGLSSSDAAFDENNDGLDEGLSSTGFNYDASGRVVGYRMQRQLDANNDGIMDIAQTINMTLDPDFAIDPDFLMSAEIGPAAASIPSASPSAAVQSTRVDFDENLFMIAYLAQAAPVEIKNELFSLGRIFPLALDTPEAMLPKERTTTTFSYNAQGKPLEISVLYESNPSVYLAKVSSGTFLVKTLQSFTYDEKGNRTKFVETLDYENDGWPEEKRIVNNANTYEGGRLIEVIQTDPASTRVVTFTYTYDEAGKRLMERREQSNDGEVVDIDLTEWTYDAAGRRASEVERDDWDVDGIWNEDHGVKWSYDENGRLASEEAWNSLEPVVDRTTSYTYDDAGRLIAIRGSNPDGTAFDTTTFDYDEDGRFVGHSSDWINGDFGWMEVYTFTYDENGALAGYVFEEDVAHDGTVDRREVGGATVDGSRIVFVIEMFAGGGELSPSGKRTFDLTFSTGLPTGSMVLPYGDLNGVVVNLPVVPAYVLLFDFLHGGIGSR